MKKIPEIMPVCDAYKYKLNSLNQIPSGHHYVVLLYRMYDETDSVQNVDQYIFTNKEELTPFIKYLSLNNRKFIFFELKGVGQIETQLKLVFPK